MNEEQTVKSLVLQFVEWLDSYGETSYDHQSYFAGPFGRRAKRLYYRQRLLGTLAVSPMILSEAFLPSARKLFWKKQRFPIADAHYAMGFAFLAKVTENEKFYHRAVHFLEVLETTRCPGYTDFCWGYPFDWETQTGTMHAGTPLITTVPYVYEAFREVYRIDGKPRWLQVMQSIAKHAARDYRDVSRPGEAASCSYNPDPNDPCVVINASAYRGCLLTQAAVDFENDEFRRIAEKNLRFVINSQNEDGSWFYAVDGKRDFVDHFHTCFVLKALAKAEAIAPSAELTAAIERGVSYYVNNLFDEQAQPKPFSRRPRLTVYRQELYDRAECINLGVLLRGRSVALDQIVSKLVPMDGWVKPDGSFRSRQLHVGWDNVPMHRWAQSQMFRSLCLWLNSYQKPPEGSSSAGSRDSFPAAVGSHV